MARVFLAGADAGAACRAEAVREARGALAGRSLTQGEIQHLLLAVAAMIEQWADEAPTYDCKSAWHDGLNSLGAAGTAIAEAVEAEWEARATWSAA